VQVDPTKPTLKAPGNKRRKLKFGVTLSNFAFKSNLRRYNEGAAWGEGLITYMRTDGLHVSPAAVQELRAVVG
jgi:hypothetical protein